MQKEKQREVEHNPTSRTWKMNNNYNSKAMMKEQQPSASPRLLPKSLVKVVEEKKL